MLPRSLHAVVGPAEMRKLVGIEPQEFNRALMNTVGISTNQRLEIFNRMLNIVSENSALNMQAKTLARNPEPKGSHVQFHHFRDGLTSGRLGKVIESANGDIVIEVNGEFKVVAGNREIKVWPLETKASPVKEDKVADSGYLTAEHIASHLSTFFGRTIAVKFEGVGRLTQVITNASEPGHYTFTYGGHKVMLPENETVYVHPKNSVDHTGSPMNSGRYPWGNPTLSNVHRVGKTVAQDTTAAWLDSYLTKKSDQPDYTGDAWWYYNNRTCAGKTVKLGSGDPAKSGVKGLCTQVVYEDGKLVFVIDGLIYKRNRHFTLRVWDKKEN